MAEDTENIVDVIDLTDSFMLHYWPESNIVINLDESCNSPVVSKKKAKRNKSSKHLFKENDEQYQENSSKLLKDSSQQRKDSNFGGCPICWEDLRSNPLASTKCGHVYCYKCLQEALRVEKKCPTCRCALKKASDYHPIYLP